MNKKDLELDLSNKMSTRQIASKYGIGQSTVRYWMKKFGLKAVYSQFKKRWEDTELISSVKVRSTFSDVIRDLGLNPKNAGNFKTIQFHINRLNLDTSHFKEKAHGKGGKRISLSEILVENSSYFNTSKLAPRLIKNKIFKPECSICGVGKWQQKPLRLHLDHINGINNDNRIENLRLLCPNCHSQTPTYCRRNCNKG